MAGAKGIVSNQYYTFSAANKTIKFSSDYAGLDLGEITYITNIKNGVATVIYDPFDATKGGTLNGLTLTLAYNTTTMSDSDPLQIIVGFTPQNADPTPVKVVDTPTTGNQTDILQNISDDMDLIALALDQNEGIQLNVREVNPPKRDANNAQINSDSITYSAFLNSTNSALTVDTTGYNSIQLIARAASASTNLTCLFENSPDNISYLNIAPNVNMGSSTNSMSSTSQFSQTGFTTSYFVLPVTMRYFRIRPSTVIGDGTTVYVTLRQAPMPTGPFTQVPVSVPTGVTVTSFQNSLTVANSAGSTNGIGGGLYAAGPAPSGSNYLGYPMTMGGVQSPFVGALSGIIRNLQVDGQGRVILGTDYSTGGLGNSSLPPRGVGGIPNNIMGSQSLTTTDASQVEGDTNTMLLKQILQELKILNQQFTELPILFNMGLTKMSDPQEYRDDNSNLF